MSLPTLLLVAAAAWWWYHRRPRHGAGASATARARTLRTPLVRLADALHIHTRAGTLARRYAAGAAGEKRTAARLAPLTREGWHVYHDRGLPTGRANIDHLLISPTGAVYLPDTKRWSAAHPVRIRAGRLLHGTRDVTTRLDGLHHEATTVSRILGVPVTPLVIMDGPTLLGPHDRRTSRLELHGVRIIPADHITGHLRHQARIPGQRRPTDLATAVERHLPPYTRHHHTR